MYPTSPPAFRRRDMAFVVALHGAAVWGLLQMNVISLPAPLAVLTLSLVPHSEAIKSEPEIVPPKPKPEARRPAPLQQPTRLAAPTEAPVTTSLTLAPAPTVVALTAPAAVPVPAPLATQPRFDADYLDNPKPVYPAISRQLREQGRVVLRVQVAADGRADDVQLHTSSGSSRLDQSALDTVRRWKFAPARLGMEPIAAWVLIPIAFTLKD